MDIESDQLSTSNQNLEGLSQEIQNLLMDINQIEIKPQQPLNNEEQQRLKQEALDYKEILDKDSQISFDNNPRDFYYLISTKFLKRWKQYVSYEESISDQPFSQYMGGPKIISKINEDLLDLDFEGQQPTKRKIFEYQDSQNISIKDYTHYNTFLKDDIQEYEHYQLISEDMWNFFANKYDSCPIKRDVITLSNGSKKVECHLKKLYLILTHNGEIKDIDFKYIQDFRFFGYIQVSNYSSVDDFYKIMENQIQLQASQLSAQQQNGVSRSNNLFSVPDSDFIRIWKLNSTINQQQFFEYVKKCANTSSSCDYKFLMDGDLIKQSEDMSNIQDCEIIDNIIILDVKQQYSQTSYTFFNSQVPKEGKCEGCYSYGLLPITCACKKVSYCKQSCKDKDYIYHENKCDAPIDEGLGPERSENSKMGITGLNNIGNTCFMNSGLQCLSNCIQITDYFLQSRYLLDLNKDAPLGTKGELTNAYGVLIKKLWFGVENSVNPRAFKKILSKHHTLFEGYNQHDSQEFLTELLSSISEDLNLIKKKPATEAEDNDGPAEYWQKFVERNNSILTYLINGQFKSQLKCPDCEKISITYDPYLMIQLPIPKGDKKKNFTLIFIHNDEFKSQQKINIQYSKSQDTTVLDIKKKVAEELNLDYNNLISYICNEYYFDEIIVNDTQISALKSKIKYKSIFIKHLNTEEQNISEQNLVKSFMKHKKQKQSYTSYKSTFSPLKVNFWSDSVTLKQVHLQFYKQLKVFLSGIIDENKSDEENYETIFLQLDQKLQDEDEVTKGGSTDDINQDVPATAVGDKVIPPYTLLIENKGSQWQECIWCKQKSCSSCKLQYTDDITLGEYKKLLENATNIYSNNKDVIDLEIEWEQVGEEYKDSEDLFTTLSEKLNTTTISINAVQKEIQVKQAQQKSDENDVEPIEEEKCQIQEKQEEEEDIGPLDLYKLLKFFETPEQLDAMNEVYCRQCKEHKQMQKQMNIQSAPQILMFQLKRFYRKNPQSALMKKINTQIDFPVNDLDLTDYLIDKKLTGLQELETQERVLYDLIGVSIHSGSLLGGHYTAYAKNPLSQKWYYYNDSSVTLVTNEQEIVTSGAYVLFYQRKHTNITDQQLQQIIYNKLYNGQIPDIDIEQFQGQDNQTQQNQEQQQQQQDQNTQSNQVVEYKPIVGNTDNNQNDQQNSMNADEEVASNQALPADNQETMQQLMEINNGSINNS